MTERMQHTVDLVKSGRYDYQRIGGIVLAVCGAVEAAAQAKASIPPVLAPAIDALRPWAFFVGFIVTSLLVKVGKPVLVK